MFSKEKLIICTARIMSQANLRRMMVETGHSVQCIQCRIVRSLSCFVGMSWRAEPSDSQMTVSSEQNER